MSEVGHVGHHHAGGTDSAGSIQSLTPVTSQDIGKPSDSIEKSSGSSGSSKTINADSPELLEAEASLWLSNIQWIVQNNSASNTHSPETVKLTSKDKMSEIAVKVLVDWNKSVKEQGEALRRNEKAERSRDELAAKHLAGEEALQSTLTSDRLSKVANINEGFAQGLEDILSKAKAGDPSFTSVIPFLAGAAASTGMPGTITVGAAQVNDGISSVLTHVAPSYSVDLSTLASLYVNGAMNYAAIQTFSVAPGASAPKIDYEYARNYSQHILKIVNGSDFNTWAMAIVTHSMQPGERLDEKRTTTLVRMLKTSMLATSLAFLYSMESSFKGKGGGITGIEFKDLLNGTIPVDENDPKAPLIAGINQYLDPMSTGERDRIIASVSSWIDDSAKGLNLTRVSPLFNILKMDTGPSVGVVAA